MMAHEITPALTAEEWESARLALGATIVDYADRIDSLSDPDQGSYRDTVAAYAALMALANEALPNGHPLKITPGMRWLLRAAADRLEPQFRAVADDVRAFAAQLAAILPP